MLNVLAGRLSEDLEVKKTKSGKEVCNTGIYVWPGKKGMGKDAPDRDAILVRVEAWGENAHELAKYGKGETIQFVGKAIDVKYKPTGLDRELTIMGYDIKKIDHSKTILSKVNEMLMEYVKEDKREVAIEKNKDKSETLDLADEMRNSTKKKNVQDKEKVTQNKKQVLEATPKAKAEPAPLTR